MASMSLQSAYDQARQWLESNDLDRAIGLSQHILEHYPDNLEAYRILGEAYLANRQLDRAQEAFERVLHSDPENIPAHVGMGITYERQGKLERAIPEFEQALEIKPDMAELRSQLLRLYTDAWGGENAQLRLSRAGLARLYAKGHMLPQAISEFRQVIGDQPGRFDAMVALAEALWRDGEEDDAIAVCRDILAKRPESLKANLLLGYLEMASGQPEGERFWEAARRMDPYQVVANAMFETLPPAIAGEPMIEEWDEAAWQRRRTEAQQEYMPATRPMEAVTPTGVPAAESFRSAGWGEPRRTPPAPPTAMDDADDFLAGLLSLDTPPAPAPSAPAPTPALGAFDDDDLDLIGFSLDDLQDQQSAPPSPTSPAAPDLALPAESPAPATPEHDDGGLTMTPFSLADLGLSEDEIAGLDSLGSVETPAPEARRTMPLAPEADADLQPFSLADLGLSEDEIAGLDSLSGPASAPRRDAPREMAPPPDEGLESEDLPLDLQPFSLDELDLGMNAEPDKPTGSLPASLQPFSLDELPPRPRVSGFAAEESFENASDEEDILPDTGGYSWQQPTQRPETGFLKRGSETPSDDVSIFAKLKQRRQQEPEPEPSAAEPAQSETLDVDADLGLFSLDDISLRDDPDLTAPAEPAAPPSMDEQQAPAAHDLPPRAAPPEVENLEDAIAAGQVQPFSLADLGLSEEEIAALGLGDAGSATPSPAAEGADQPTLAEPSGDLYAPADEWLNPPAAEAAPPAATAPAAPAEREEIDDLSLPPSDLKPFSLTDLGLSDDEIAALGLGESAEAEDEPRSELGLTEEELAGLDMVDLPWGAPAPAAQAETQGPAAQTEAPAPEATEQHLSGDLVVDRLIALGRQQGFVDISDIIAGVEDPEAEAERIEEIGRLLHEAKVEIRDGDEVIDMDADYAEEEDLAAEPESPMAESPAVEEDEEPAMTPFSLSELGLTEDEIAALGLSEPVAAPAEEPAASAPEPEPPVAPVEEPVMTPFSLSELGLTEDEIAALGLSEPVAAPAEEPALSAPEPEPPMAPAEEPAASAPEPEPPTAPADEEPVMTPFSLSELGLTEDEIAALEMPGAFDAEEAPEAASPRAPFEPPYAEPPRAPREPELPPVTPPESPRAPEPPVTPPAKTPAASRAAPVAPRSAPPTPAAAPHSGNDVLENFVSRLERDPQNHALRLSVARVAGQIGRTDFAMQQYKQLIKSNVLLDEVMEDISDLISDADDRPLLQRLHRLRGDVYSKQGRFNEAIEDYSWTLSESR